MKLLVRLVIVGASVLIFASCGSAPSAGNTEASITDSGQLTTFDLTARTIGGAQSFSLNEALKQRPVALWFWAPG